MKLFSAGHLVRTHHGWACTSTPITDPATGRPLALHVSGPLDTLSADALRMVRCSVRVAEALLGVPGGGTSLGTTSNVRAPMQPTRRPVSAVEALEQLGERPAAVFRYGSPTPLTFRLAEILTVPDSRSQGWTGQKLAYELFGDMGMPLPLQGYRKLKHSFLRPINILAADG